MAFTAHYVDLSTLAQSSIFGNRVTAAVANYAKYIIGEDPATAFHTSRAAWAKGAAISPSATASQILYLCALDPAYASQATVPIDPNSVNDTTLDTVVQTAINTTILKF